MVILCLIKKIMFSFFGKLTRLLVLSKERKKPNLYAVKVVLVPDNIILPKVRSRLDLDNLKILFVGPIMNQPVFLTFFDDDETTFFNFSDLVPDHGVTSAMNHKPHLPAVLVALQRKSFVGMDDETFNFAIAVKEDVEGTPRSCLACIGSGHVSFLFVKK